MKMIYKNFILELNILSFLINQNTSYLNLYDKCECAEKLRFLQIKSECLMLESLYSYSDWFLLSVLWFNFFSFLSILTHTYSHLQSSLSYYNDHHHTKQTWSITTTTDTEKISRQKKTLKERDESRRKQKKNKSKKKQE